MPDLLTQFGQDFLGVAAPIVVTRPDGTTVTVGRTYLDSAATCLMPGAVMRAVMAYLANSCANSHTHSSTSGMATTIAIDRTHQLVGRLVGYDPSTDCVILTGSGSTGPLNLLARALMTDPTRPLVVISSQEHHSNLLPWVQVAGQENVRFIPALPDGSLDMKSLAALLDKNRGRVRVVAVTALSNVTGIVNPVNQIAQMAHAAGAEIVVDAAQAGAHVPVSMHPGQSGADLDYVVLSGHKLYAPGSPGALVGKKALFASCPTKIGQVGGGTVDYVGLDSVRYASDPAVRQEAGTPNIPGTIALGVALGILETIGIPALQAHERPLVDRALVGLAAIPGIVLYGPLNTAPTPDRPAYRAAVVSFNLGSMPHGLVAAALNDYFGIAVRNDCFCAQPYVRQQIYSACSVNGFCEPIAVPKRGMVRASFGVYTQPGDVDNLVRGVAWIQQNGAWLETQYDHDGKGNYVHRTFRRPLPFSIDAEVSAYTGYAIPAAR